MICVSSSCNLVSVYDFIFGFLVKIFHSSLSKHMLFVVKCLSGCCRQRIFKKTTNLTNTHPSHNRQEIWQWRTDWAWLLGYRNCRFLIRIFSVLQCFLAERTHTLTSSSCTNTNSFTAPNLTAFCFYPAGSGCSSFLLGEFLHHPTSWKSQPVEAFITHCDVRINI